MTPDEMRRAADYLQELASGHDGYGRSDDEKINDLARLLREEAEAPRFRVLLQADAYCPGCGHNRSKSSVSTIKRDDGMRECQMCGAAWSEIPPPPQGREG